MLFLDGYGFFRVPDQDTGGNSIYSFHNYDRQALPQDQNNQRRLIKRGPNLLDKYL
jgi:hypothetical protein